MTQQRQSPDLARYLAARGIARLGWGLVVYLCNWLLILNLALNTLLGGHPQETMSSRIAKHADIGRRWAMWAGKVLTAIFRDGDHLREELSFREGRKHVWDKGRWVLVRGDRDRSLIA